MSAKRMRTFQSSGGQQRQDIAIMDAYQLPEELRPLIPAGKDRTVAETRAVPCCSAYTVSNDAGALLWPQPI